MDRKAMPRKRGFVLMLLAAFVLFCMPTPQDQGVYVGETIHAASAHDVANSMKATKRVAPPTLVKLLQLAALSAVFSVFLLLERSPYRSPLVKAFFIPVVSLRLRTLMLRPLKFTSLFV